MTLTFLHKMGQHYQGITIYASSSEVYATEITRQITMRCTTRKPTQSQKTSLLIKSCPVAIL
ncbi:hypothetical protein PSHT_12281 [Puccinia striiformis]|uniref:Uncharacterized protein n=3 Tax=Puccinia striiformis TaxID=27350 RepID=A0A2S4UGS4_9BASI|nr:hypothetical protein PSTT_15631 [Puccinia striiformis]POW02047.1 hypothetical protein PSHT_12281 [Puccinia striiformis]